MRNCSVWIILGCALVLEFELALVAQATPVPLQAPLLRMHPVLLPRDNGSDGGGSEDPTAFGDESLTGSGTSEDKVDATSFDEIMSQRRRRLWRRDGATDTNGSDDFLVVDEKNNGDSTDTSDTHTLVRRNPDSPTNYEPTMADASGGPAQVVGTTTVDTDQSPTLVRRQANSLAADPQTGFGELTRRSPQSGNTEAPSSVDIPNGSDGMVAYQTGGGAFDVDDLVRRSLTDPDESEAEDPDPSALIHSSMDDDDG